MPILGCPAYANTWFGDTIRAGRLGKEFIWKPHFPVDVDFATTSTLEQGQARSPRDMGSELESGQLRLIPTLKRRACGQAAIGSAARL